MKPVITSINGDQGGVAASNMPQSINFKGSGFAPDVVVVVKYTNPKNRTGQQATQVAMKGTVQGVTFKDATEFDADLNFPIDSNGPAEALAFSASNGVASDWSSFSVK